MLNYTVRDADGQRIIELSGGLDVTTVNTFKNALMNTSERDSLVLNMENINLVTIAGIRALVDLSFHAKEHGKRVVLLWPRENLLKLAESMEVFSYLIFAHSIEEAKTKIKFFT